MAEPNNAKSRYFFSRALKHPDNLTEGKFRQYREKVNASPHMPLPPLNFGR
jgi:hypothetical protein